MTVTHDTTPPLLDEEFYASVKPTDEGWRNKFEPTGPRLQQEQRRPHDEAVRQQAGLPHGL